MNFRKDINGLRAVAVISVIFFHFSHSFLSGGFAGVDVFFVISGFLMTSIIINGLQNDTFSIINFLKARIIRIVPALLFTIFILLIIAYLFLEPLSYQLLGKHSADSLLFISNYTYKNESGYFDLDSYSKFLLHTWSLSVEWQFYFIYPFVLLILGKAFNNNFSLIKKIILSLCILFFIYALFISFKRPTSAYYMLYARAWELLAGACVFLFPLRGFEKYRREIEIFGLLLIILALFVIDSNTRWPGYMALLPVMGASICIMANNNKSIFSNPILNKIGLWSYSIYLVHWPVIVFFKKLNVELHLLSYLSIVFLCSFFMYELIEKRRNYKYGFIVLYILTIIVSFYISYDGLKNRISDKKYQLTKEEFHKKYYGGNGYNGGSIQYLNSNKDTFKTIFYGDSLAWQYAKYIDKSKHPSVTFFQNGCFSLPKAFVAGTNRDKCKKQFNIVKLFAVNSKNKNIVISQNWTANNVIWTNNKDNQIKFNDISNYKDFLKGELSLFIEEIGADKQYFIVGKTTIMKAEDTFTCLARHDLPIYKYLKTKCLYNQSLKDQKEILDINNFLNDFSKQYKNVHFIDPNKTLCNEDKCMLIINNEPVYSDMNHLSIYGAEVVGKQIIENIENLKN